MRTIKYLVLILSFTACQESFEPDRNADPQYVVEGYVEAGEGSERSFVILTQSLAFLDEVSAQDFNSMFVRDALVQVTTGSQTVAFTEICLFQILQLPPDLIAEIELVLGFKIEDSIFDLCVYVDLEDKLERKVGNDYHLNISFDEEVLTATTTIPDFIPLTDFEFRPIPGEPIDSLRRLNCFIDDPVSEDNFYRYKTKINDKPILIPFFSVAHDAFFNGQRFEFPLDKAWEEGLDTDLALSLYYTVGDSIEIKWHTLDEAHFDFWNTLEFNRANQGPLSSYTRIAGNVNGALGIWGGYAVGNYKLLVN